MVSEDCEKELLSCNEGVMMQTSTTQVKVPCGAKVEKVRIILDSGSHRTYITEEIARRLCLKRRRIRRNTVSDIRERKQQGN